MSHAGLDPIVDRPPGSASRLTAGLVMVVLAALPLFIRGEYGLFLITQALLYFLVALGLNLLSGYGGQTSLGHGALVAVGAYVMAVLTVDYHFSVWLAMLPAVLATALVGAIMALPAFRLSAWYFALVTLGFATVVAGLLVEWSNLTHGFAGIIGVPLPRVAGYEFSPTVLYFLAAACALLAFAITRNLIRSRYGRALLAMRDVPIAAIGCGIGLVRLKLLAFVFSAVLAGLAGALLAIQKTVVTPDDFPVDFSIFFLLVVVLGGLGRLYGPALGTLAFFVLPELMTYLERWRLLVYGVALLLVMLFAPSGLAGLLERFLTRRRRPAVPASPAGLPDPEPTIGASLAVEQLGKRFGGLTALSQVSLEVVPGEVHGIVGPNGSGKTTLLNLITGFYRPDGGAIRVGDSRIDRLPPTVIARDHARRTFQTPKLVGELSLLDNVLLGAATGDRASFVAVALRLPRARREAARRRAEALRTLAFVGLDQHAHLPAQEVPHGHQRLAEIARALLGQPRLLLLDEPAAGLSMTELERLEELLRAIARLGITTLLVEHHLSLVMRLCHRVTVLDRGTVTATGTPVEVFNDANVMAAYMGSRSVPAAGA